MAPRPPIQSPNDPLSPHFGDFWAPRAPRMAPSLRRSVNPWIHRCIGPGSIDASTHRSIDRCMSWGPSTPRPIDASFYRSVDPWIHRCIDRSIDPISVDTWIHISIDPWMHRCIDLSIIICIHPSNPGPIDTSTHRSIDPISGDPGSIDASNHRSIDA